MNYTHLHVLLAHFTVNWTELDFCSVSKKQKYSIHSKETKINSHIIKSSTRECYELFCLIHEFLSTGLLINHLIVLALMCEVIFSFRMLLWLLYFWCVCVCVSVCVCVIHQVVCVGSMAELEELTGVKVTDLHRERWVTYQPPRLSAATWTCTQSHFYLPWQSSAISFTWSVCTGWICDMRIVMQFRCLSTSVYNILNPPCPSNVTWTVVEHRSLSSLAHRQLTAFHFP